MSIKKVIKQLLQKPLSGVVNYILKMFNVFIVYRIGSAIGDQLFQRSTTLSQTVNTPQAHKVEIEGHAGSCQGPLKGPYLDPVWIVVRQGGMPG